MEWLDIMVVIYLSLSNSQIGFVFFFVFFFFFFFFFFFGLLEVLCVFLFFCFFFFWSFCFFRTTPASYGGSQSYRCWPTAQPQQHQNWAMSATYTTAHSNPGSLTHWARAEFQSAASWFLVGFVSVEPRGELPNPFSKVIVPVYVPPKSAGVPSCSTSCPTWGGPSLHSGHSLGGVMVSLYEFNFHFLNDERWASYFSYDYLPFIYLA